MRIALIMALLAGLFLVGCSVSSEETSKPKEPDITADQAAKNLAKAKIPSKAKEVLSGSLSQNKAGSE